MLCYLVDKTKTKFRLPLKLSDRAQNLPGPAPQNDVLRVLQISSKSVHFRRSYSRTHEHRQGDSLSRFLFMSVDRNGARLGHRLVLFPVTTLSLERLIVYQRYQLSS